MVARGVAGAVKLGSVRTGNAPHIMPGSERRRAKVACGRQEIAKLDALIASNARDRSFAALIGVGEILDDFFAKPILVIEYVMGDAEPLGDARGVVDVLPGAAGALARDSGAVVVKLQRNADDLEAALGQHGRGHR